MDFEVLVQLKTEVLDPEARAIRETLLSRGISGVEAVNVAKRYLVTLSDSEEDSEQKIRQIADQYLANPVSQVYQIKRLSR